MPTLSVPTRFGNCCVVLFLFNSAFKLNMYDALPAILGFSLSSELIIKLQVDDFELSMLVAV